MNLLELRSHQRPSAFTETWSRHFAESPTTPSTKSRSGATAALVSPAAMNPKSRAVGGHHDDDDHRKEVRPSAQGRSCRDELGSDHSDRRQPRNLYQDRLQEQAGGRMLQHVI